MAEGAIKYAEFHPDINACMVAVLLALMFGFALGRGITGERLPFKLARTRLWMIGAIVFTLYSLTPLFVSFWMKHLFTDGELARHGQFGDLFGSVNALFSCFAFIGVLVSLHLQQGAHKVTSRMAAMTTSLDVLSDRIESERKAIAYFGGSAAFALEGDARSFADAWSNADFVAGGLGPLKNSQDSAERELEEITKINGKDSPEYDRMLRVLNARKCILISAIQLKNDLERREFLLGELVPFILPTSED